MNTSPLLTLKFSCSSATKSSCLIGFIDGENAQLYITIVHGSCGRIISTVQSYACQSFVSTVLPKIFNSKHFKAVIITTCNVVSTDFPSNLQFKTAIKEKLDQMGIINYYITKENFIRSQCLIAANLTVKIDRIVLIVMGVNDNVEVTELLYTENGYKILRSDRFVTTSKQRIMNPDSICKRIHSLCKPKRIILCSGSFTSSTPPKYLKSMLKPSNRLTVVDRQNFIDVSIIETFKMFNDNNYVKYRIIPTCSHEYHLGFKYGSTCHRKIVAEFGETLPFMKAVCIPKSCLDFYIAYVDSSINETFYTEWFSLDNDAHRYELILKVDEGNFPSYEVKSIIFDNIKNMPGKLTSDLNGIPVIGFYDDSSVICVCQNDEYKFLNVWNGIFGNQLLIAFDEVKPKLFNKAAESHRRKPSFVVSDLINIMSRSPEEQINKWQFKVTRDAKNPILIEFDCYGGMKKAATPAFLMGMLLKEHLKAIKYETGENPTEIGFYFINQTETERIKKQIKESCRLLKIGCIFVNA